MNRTGKNGQQTKYPLMQDNNYMRGYCYAQKNIYTGKRFTRLMMDTEKSIDCVLNLLSDILTPPIQTYYNINICNKQHSVKFGLLPSEVAAMPL